MVVSRCQQVRQLVDVCAVRRNNIEGFTILGMRVHAPERLAAGIVKPFLFGGNKPCRNLKT